MINSTKAFIIYLAAMLTAFLPPRFLNISDAVVIAYFAHLTTAFVAYITRRYYKHKLETNGK